MGDTGWVPAIPLQRYRVGPLAIYIDQLAARLLEHQYARASARHKLKVVADLSGWLQRRRLDVGSLNEDLIAAFIRRRRRYDADRHGDVAGVRSLLELLRESGVLAPPPRRSRLACQLPIELAFERYLKQERGLSQATVDNSVPFVHRFLADRLSDGTVSLSDLGPADLTGFILRSGHSLSPSRAKLLVGALRSFCRFLRLRGEIAVDLAAAVPAVADWRRSTVPKSIEPEQVERLLRSCDRRTATGLRDYAVLLLLARLGLRAGEVAALTLDDIDWEVGEITISGKGARRDRLPLPVDVGEALAAYLRHARPNCGTRRIFLRDRAPVRALMGQSSVGCIVRRRLERAGIDCARKGAHLLRHSLAVRMLRQGASLSEIGEILRHRRLDTTAIYAKVDMIALRALARPWPGGEA